MPKKLLFSVTKNCFDISTFSVSGAGGAGKDTSNSGVRLVHRDSGAVGVGTEHRSNMQNRKSAFRKLIETSIFKAWHKLECAKAMGKILPETEEEIYTRVDKMIEEGLKDGTIIIDTY